MSGSYDLISPKNPISECCCTGDEILCKKIHRGALHTSITKEGNSGESNKITAVWCWWGCQFGREMHICCSWKDSHEISYPFLLLGIISKSYTPSLSWFKRSNKENRDRNRNPSGLRVSPGPFSSGLLLPALCYFFSQGTVPVHVIYGVLLPHTLWSGSANMRLCETQVLDTGEIKEIPLPRVVSSVMVMHMILDHDRPTWCASNFFQGL